MQNPAPSSCYQLSAQNSIYSGNIFLSTGRVRKRVVSFDNKPTILIYILIQKLSGRRVISFSCSCDGGFTILEVALFINKKIFVLF